MHLNITGRHTALSDALRDYTEQRLLRIQRYISKPIQANVILSVEKYRHTAEILVQVDGLEMFAKEVTDKMYQSIDHVVGKIEKRVKKYKERRDERQKEKPRRSNASGERSGSVSLPWTLKRKGVHRIDRMSFAEGVGRLLSENGPQFIFMDEEDDKIKILNRKGKQIECAEWIL